MLYYTKTGRILNVRRGLYAVIPYNETADTVSVDPYLIAATVAQDGILAYHTAVELHGLAYSHFGQFTFITNQKIKPFVYQDQYYQPVSVNLSLKKQHSEQFGVEKIYRQGLSISITNLERTYVDLLDRVKLSGGWEEVIRSINKIALLRVDQVIQYCLKLNNQLLAAKVGFFLEQRQGAFTVPNEQLLPLLALKPQSPQYLSENQNYGYSKLIKKWNIIIPDFILTQSWEEPNNNL